MEVSYKRIRGLSYLTLSEDPQLAGEHYQKAIFLENRIPGLLSCKLQRLNGEESFCYDITGCQSLKNLFEKEKLTRKDLEELLQSWLKLWESLEEYLLDTDFLLLDPAYLYRETQSGHYRFVWFPYQIREKENTFQVLAEYFLPRIDHKDKGAVALGYRVYKEAVEENIYPDIIKNLLGESVPQIDSRNLYRQEEESPFLQIEAQEKEEQEKQRQKILDDFYSEEEEASASYGILGGVAGIVFLCILVFLFWHFHLLSIFQLALFLAVLLVLSGLGVLLYFFLVRKKEKSLPELPKKPEKPSSPPPGPSPSEILPSPFLSAPEKTGSSKQDHSFSESLTVLLKETESRGPQLTGLGRNAGKVFVLEKEETLIGKWAPSADIYLDAPTVSRIHARILREGNRCYVVDLNSKNGTLLNGLPLDPEEKKPLENNDILSFAKEEFRYTSLPSQPLHTGSEN